MSTDDTKFNQLLDWTITEHHAHPAVGSTMLKTFIDSREAFYAWFVAKTESPPKQTKEQMFGNAFHTYLLEPDEFSKLYTTWPADCEGNGATKAVKRARAMFALNNRKAVLTRSQMKALEAMRRNTLADREARRLLETPGDTEKSGNTEQSAVWRHHTGIECKARFDRILDNMTIVDLKTTKAAANVREWERECRKMQHALQAAFYLMGRRAVFGDVVAPFYHIAVGNAWPFAATVYELDGLSLEFAWNQVERELVAMSRCFETGNWSNPLSHKINKVSI